MSWTVYIKYSSEEGAIKIERKEYSDVEDAKLRYFEAICLENAIGAVVIAHSYFEGDGVLLAYNNEWNDWLDLPDWAE